jgi:zinc protease
MAGAGVRTDVTGPSIDEVLKEITKMRDAGVTDDELKMAKDSMVRSLPANFETTSSTAGTMAQIYLFDLPLDYYQSYPGRLDAITKEDVGAIAKKYLTPDRMLIVAVGDKKVIEPQISKLSLGTIAYRDADGKEVASSN